MERFPSIVLWPVLLWALCTGLGVFGVVYGGRLAKNTRVYNAGVQASHIASSFQLVLQQAYAPALALGFYLERQPNFTQLQSGGFDSLAWELVTQMPGVPVRGLVPSVEKAISSTTYSDLQVPGLSQLEIAPNGIITNVLPDNVSDDAAGPLVNGGLPSPAALQVGGVQRDVLALDGVDVNTEITIGQIHVDGPQQVKQGAVRVMEPEQLHPAQQ